MKIWRSSIQNPEFPSILSDQRMPGKTGVEFFEETEKYCPDSLRVLISGYSVIEVTIAAVNQGKTSTNSASPSFNGSDCKRREIRRFQKVVE